jgi:hypothetical protein
VRVVGAREPLLERAGRRLVLHVRDLDHTTDGADEAVPLVGLDRHAPPLPVERLQLVEQSGDALVL